MSGLCASKRPLIGPVALYPAENKASGRQRNLHQTIVSFYLWSMWRVGCGLFDQLTVLQWKPFSVKHVWLGAWNNRIHIFIAAQRIISFLMQSICHRWRLLCGIYCQPNVLFILTRGSVINTRLSVRGPIYLWPWRVILDTGLQLPGGLLSRCLHANESELCKTNVLWHHTFLFCLCVHVRVCVFVSCGAVQRQLLFCSRCRNALEETKKAKYSGVPLLQRE